MTQGTVVTIKKVFKETGVSQKSGKPWTRFDVVDTNDTRYKTFNFQLGQQAENAEGKAVGLEFHVEQQGNYQNNILDSIDLNASQNGHAVYNKEEFSAHQHNQNVAPKQETPAYFSDLAKKDERPLRSHETNRAAALELAIQMVKPDTTPLELYRVADANFKFIVEGLSAFGQF